ncbi:lipoprotein [Spiroplasma taiwanense]|uniref:Lipoprotein n=1 Tax=Spiroplasma taiwanense CT-1 TaxID=1276220 RepID=S5M114_9MOLU|nr:lipoprotein [Spiroplasma taiwanense]AGR41692.1 hypothetical protein STAIW_v1c11090 [Spiroplasma taiwanense CT-1]
MKKILSLLGVAGLTATTAVTVVSCGTEKDPSEMTKEERIAAIKKLAEEAKNLINKANKMKDSGDLLGYFRIRTKNRYKLQEKIYKLDMGEKLVEGQYGMSTEEIIKTVKEGMSSLQKKISNGEIDNQKFIDGYENFKKEVHKYWGISE